MISKSDVHGGAAIAAYRLMYALNSEGENAKMLVCDKRSDNLKVIQGGSKLNNRWNFYRERGEIFLYNHLSRKFLFDISIANTGLSITELDEFKNADVIHLHWINQGMLSIKEIEKILLSGKKVVWTMHDMWPFTGICHHSGDCNKYENSCGRCPYIANPSDKDLSNSIFNKKKDIYSKGNITFVACSDWLKKLAEKSPLTNGHKIVSVPNPIDTDLYKPKDKLLIREKLNISDEDADKYIKIFTSLPKEEIDALTAEQAAAPHLRPLQRKLAEELTVMVHSREDYNMAVDASQILFGRSTSQALRNIDEETFMQVFEGVPQFTISKDKLSNGIKAVDLLTDDAAVFPSKGEMRKTQQAGDVMYKDLNGDGVVNNGANTLDDHGDMTIIGNSIPRYKFGVTLDAAWKEIDLRVFFQGVGKRDYMLGGPYFWGASGGMWQSTAFEEHWDFFRDEDNPLGANLDAYYPRPLFSGEGKNQYTQTRYLQNAAYLRLKNIQLGYTLPSSIVNKAGMQNVRFYISGDNLLTLSEITGVFDPELLGGDWGNGKLYPLSKVISVGLNINF